MSEMTTGPADREAIFTDEVREVIVLMSCRNGRAPVAESIIVTAACEHRAFMAPSTVAYLADGHSGVQLVCSRCFDASRMFDYDLHLAPGAPAELEAAVGIAKADQFMAWARNVGFK